MLAFLRNALKLSKQQLQVFLMLLVVCFTFFLPETSFAAVADIDISGSLDFITKAVAAAVGIGVAYLGFVAAISVFKKLRAAI